MKLTAHTISKFGKNKGTITSNDAEFYFYYWYKMYNQTFCYKCFESCFNCSEPGNETYHNCDECSNDKSYYYFTDNNKKNCYSSCKTVNKLRKEIDSSKICINKEDCLTYISSDEEIYLINCMQNSEYFYNKDGKISKTCINYCNDWISEDNTTCTTKCEYLNQLSNILTHKCVSKCPNNLFYNPELMTCDDKCKEPYKYFIDYKNLLILIKEYILDLDKNKTITVDFEEALIKALQKYALNMHLIIN